MCRHHRPSIISISSVWASTTSASRAPDNAAIKFGKKISGPALQAAVKIRLASSNVNGSRLRFGSRLGIAFELDLKRFLPLLDFSALCQKAVDRQRSGAPQDEGRKAREVKEIGFITRRSEL